MQLHGRHLLLIDPLLMEQADHRGHPIPVHLSTLLAVASEEEERLELLVMQNGDLDLMHLRVQRIGREAIHIGQDLGNPLLSALHGWGRGHYEKSSFVGRTQKALHLLKVLGEDRL